MFTKYNSAMRDVTETQLYAKYAQGGDAALVAALTGNFNLIDEIQLATRPETGTQNNIVGRIAPFSANNHLLVYGGRTTDMGWGRTLELLITTLQSNPGATVVLQLFPGTVLPRLQYRLFWDVVALIELQKSFPNNLVIVRPNEVPPLDRFTPKKGFTNELPGSFSGDLGAIGTACLNYWTALPTSVQTLQGTIGVNGVNTVVERVVETAPQPSPRSLPAPPTTVTHTTVVVNGAGSRRPGAAVGTLAPEVFAQLQETHQRAASATGQDANGAAPSVIQSLAVRRARELAEEAQEPQAQQEAGEAVSEQVTPEQKYEGALSLIRFMRQICDTKVGKGEQAKPLITDPTFTQLVTQMPISTMDNFAKKLGDVASAFNAYLQTQRGKGNVTSKSEKDINGYLQHLQKQNDQLLLALRNNPAVYLRRDLTAQTLGEFLEAHALSLQSQPAATFAPNV